MVKYRQLNLLSDFSHLGTFDVIFCRNVLIYFDQETKINVLNRLAARSAPRWLSRARRGGDRGRPHRRLQAVPERRGLYAPNHAALEVAGMRAGRR